MKKAPIEDKPTKRDAFWWIGWIITYPARVVLNCALGLLVALVPSWDEWFMKGPPCRE